MRKTWLLVLSFALIIGILAACGDKDNSEEGSNNNGNNAEQPDMPEPDLEGIPDVVAEVNDEEITKDDFENMYQQQFQNQIMQAQMSGQSVDDLDQDDMKKQVAESMVGQQLLIQEATAQIDDVSEDDINKTIDEVVEQNGMEDKDELLAAFEEQGMDEDEFMEQVEQQVRVDQLLEKESGDIEPSDDEVKDAYDDVKKQQEASDSDEDVPEFDDIKDQLKEQLKGQKQQEVTEKLVDKLRDKADVTINI